MENLRMEKSIYENPLYRALISSKVDEKLAVDAVLSITSFNPNLATKEDINSLRTEMKEEILRLATKEEINSLRLEVKDALAKQTRWITGVVLANISIAMTILGFMLAS